MLARPNTNKTTPKKPAKDDKRTAPAMTDQTLPSAPAPGRLPRIVTPEAKRQQEDFAEKLQHLMQLRSMSQSDLARQIWGTTKDKRGYEVARNRDRISTYLAGAGIPEPENLKKLAAALGVQVQDLIDWDTTKPLTQRAASARVDVHLALAPGQPGMMHLQVNTILPSNVAMEIIMLIEKHRTP